MTGDHIMTGEEKLLMLANQMDVSQETPTIIFCPYCNGSTIEGEVFCCNTIVRALSAIADARDRFGLRR
jgi:hypothetical protein